MATSKDQFLLQSDEEIAELVKILNSSRFERLLTYTRAEFSERFCPSSEQLAGINNFINTLNNMVEEEEPMIEVESGLKHDLSVPERLKPETK